MANASFSIQVVARLRCRREDSFLLPITREKKALKLSTLHFPKNDFALVPSEGYQDCFIYLYFIIENYVKEI